MTPAPDLSREDRGIAVVVLLAAVALLIVFAAPMLDGRLYTADDLGVFHLPTRAFYSRCLARGEDFRWWPGIFCGYDLLGEGQAGMLHPLHLALYALFPLGAAFSLELFLSYPVMFAGAWLALRRRGLPSGAAAMGGFAAAFSGYTFSHYVHMHCVAIVAQIPWILLLCDVTLTSTRPRRAVWAALGVGLLTTSQLLLGHPQHVWFSMLAEVVYAAMLFPEWRDRRRVAALVVFQALGVAAASCQLLPSWGCLRQSVRAEPTREFLDTDSLPPADLAQIVSPYVFRDRVFGRGINEFVTYNGALVPAMAVWVLAWRRRLGQWRRLVVWSAVGGAAALVLALGRYGGVYRLQAWLPLVGLFRCPCRYLLLYQLATAALVAGGFASMLELRARGERAPWRALAWLGLAPVASAVVSLGVAWWLRSGEASHASRLAPTRWVVAGPLLILAATVLTVAAARRLPFALAALALFGGLELGFYDATCFRRSRPTTLRGFVAWVPTRGDLGPDRVYVYEWTGANRLTMRGVRLASGYSGINPKKRLDYEKRKSLQAAGVRWRARVNPRGLTWRTVGLRPAPRARLVSRALVSDDPARDIERIDVLGTALVERRVDLPPGPPGAAEILLDRPGRLVVRASAPDRRLLVLNESYHAGWRVRVDGRPTAALRVNGDFVGCVVEKGVSRVGLRFAPASARVGLQVTCLALAGMALAALWFLPRRRGAARRGSGYNGAAESPEAPGGH